MVLYRLILADLSTMLDRIEVTGDNWKPGERAQWTMCMEIFDTVQHQLDGKVQQVNHVLKQNKDIDEDEAYSMYKDMHGPFVRPMGVA
jgi:hypothetical protein